MMQTPDNILGCECDTQETYLTFGERSICSEKDDSSGLNYKYR